MIQRHEKVINISYYFFCLCVLAIHLYGLLPRNLIFRVYTGIDVGDSVDKVYQTP